MAHKTLVIVESPAKAKKIAGYLGPDYTVLASVGHIRDLAAKASQLPEADRKKPWSKLAVNVDDEFQPIYVVHDSKKATIAELKKALKDADELLLATDEDREGEAISWHLMEVLRPKVPVQRMVFNEITPEAIRAAVNNPRDLDMQLVDLAKGQVAQHRRQIDLAAGAGAVDHGHVKCRQCGAFVQVFCGGGVHPDFPGLIACALRVQQPGIQGHI